MNGDLPSVDVFFDPVTGGTFFPGPLVAVDADPIARQLLRDFAARHVREPRRMMCSDIAHRDIGFCSQCIDSPVDDPRLGASYELSGWRLLAMAERGGRH